MKKTLIFEGAGCVEKNDVENCRIRTRIKNLDGRVIYFEMAGFEVSKNEKREIYKGLSVPSHIDYLFYDDCKWDQRSCTSAIKVDRSPYEYTKANILTWVNNNLNCDFDTIEIQNDGVRVFDTKEPLCDCSDGTKEPYKDIEININSLAAVKPLYEPKGNMAKYKISFLSAQSLPYVVNHIDLSTKESREKFSKYNYYAHLQWDKNGIITELSISANENFPHIGMRSEILQTVIDMIIADNYTEEPKKAKRKAKAAADPVREVYNLFELGQQMNCNGLIEQANQKKNNLYNEGMEELKKVWGVK